MTAQELKNSILQLAMQGKLVPHTNENASELLEKIKKSHADSGPLRGSLKNKKGMSVGLPNPCDNKNTIAEDEKPFDIPENWCWCRLGEILIKLTDGTHSTPKYTSNGIPFLSVKDMSSGILDFSNCKYISEKEHKELFSRCNPELGDLLLTKVGTTGIPVLVDTKKEFSLFVSVALLKFNQEFIFNKFLKYIIEAPLVQNQAKENTKGVGNKNWVMKDIANTIIPLPPLAEQKAIVAKIEELLPYIEKYDAAYTKLEEFNKKFPQDMQKSILQQAVQGKLIIGNGKLIIGETGAQLLERVRAEKAKLIAEGKIKKEKALPPITEDEIPFDIPENWCWCRLGEICSALGDGIHGTPEYDVNGEYFFVNGNNLQNGKIVLKPDTKKVNKSQYEKYKKPLNENTVFISINGTIGNIGFYNGEKIILGKSACYFNVLEKDLKSLFFYFFQTDYFFKYALEKATGTTIKNVSLDAMRKFPIPLPPLSEQKAIVAKIEELLPYIEKYDDAYTKLEEFNKKFPEDMQKSILQQAVQGKLIIGNGKLIIGETGAQLLERVRAEKAKLIAEGKIKKEKALPPITEDEIPFDIPENWCWCRLGEISTYANTKEKISADCITPEMWTLDLEDIEKNTGRIIQKVLAKDRKIAGDKVRFEKGDILYSKLRPYLKKNLIAPSNGICSSEIVPFKLYGQINSEYILKVLICPYVDFAINSVTYGVKMPRVGTDTMMNLLIPLPPLAEQKAIVTKIEELLPLCKKLINSKASA